MLTVNGDLQPGGRVELYRFDRQSQAFGCCRSFGRPGAGHDDDKFLTPVARDRIEHAGIHP